MMLKICEESIFLKLGNLEFTGTLCVFILSFCLLLVVLFKKNYIDKSILFKYKYIISFALSANLFIFIIFLYSIFSVSFYEGCGCKADMTLKKTEVTVFKPIYKNKVIIIGDSRMSLINDYKDTYDLPLNYSFIARSGTKIDWFVQNAMPELERILDNRNNDFSYHVVINMGVNDINKITDKRIAWKKADDYFKYYKFLALKYPNVKFYLLSVNPIQKEMFRKYWSMFTLENDYIENFNASIIRNVNNFNLIIYCDSYKNIDFKTYDGLHYKHETSQDIINYISNKCIRYN